MSGVEVLEETVSLMQLLLPLCPYLQDDMLQYYVAAFMTLHARSASSSAGRCVGFVTGAVGLKIDTLQQTCNSCSSVQQWPHRSVLSGLACLLYKCEAPRAGCGTPDGLLQRCSQQVLPFKKELCSAWPVLCLHECLEMCIISVGLVT